mgnify:CR=1 FL=1
MLNVAFLLNEDAPPAPWTCKYPGNSMSRARLCRSCRQIGPPLGDNEYSKEGCDRQPFFKDQPRSRQSLPRRRCGPLPAEIETRTGPVELKTISKQLVWKLPVHRGMHDELAMVVVGTSSSARRSP